MSKSPQPGAALAPLTAEGDGLPTRTVGALAATATAYATLASAAGARSPRRYAESGRAVSGADADLRRTMTKGRRRGECTPQGIDLSLPLLALLGLFAMFRAVRQTLRVLR